MMIEKSEIPTVLADPDPARMEEALSALVSCDTTFPPGSGYRAFNTLIERQFASLGGQREAVYVPEERWAGQGVHGERQNLLLHPAIGASAPAEALIYFHTDTAPIGDGWTRKSLQLTREGDRLYGRGSADMKGTIAATLDALLRLAEAKVPLAYRPVLAFCTDEEGGRYPGIRYLAETRALPPVLLNLNGSAEPRVWAGCLGSMDFIVSVHGRAAHSGDPDRGRNAIELAMPLLNALAALKPEIEVRTTAMPPPPWNDGPLRARLNVTAIHAGDKGSAIPGLCRITINRRYLPDENIAAVREELEATVQQALAGVCAPANVSLDVAGHLPPVTDPDGPATRRWTQARAQAFALPESAFERYGSGSSSDFGWIQQAGQQHMLLGGLMRPDCNVHGPDEFTTIDDLVALSRAIELFLRADVALHAPHDTQSQ